MTGSRRPIRELRVPGSRALNGGSRSTMTSRNATPRPSRVQYVLCPLLSQHALLVEVPESSLRVVARLERVVRGPVVEPPELVLREIGVGVERFDPAQLGDLALDLAVVPARLATHRVLHHVPETEVHVQRPGIDRIERESLLRIVAADGADPDRKDPDLLEEEREELRRPRDGNVHVLDHGLRVFAPQP